MLFNGYVKFKGAALFRWAQRGEDGSVELIFDRKHCESGVEFSADAWAAAMEAIGKLEAGEGELGKYGRAVFNPLHNTEAKGTIEASSMIINTYKQPLEFVVDKDEPFTVFVRKAGNKGLGDIEFTLTNKAAKQLRGCLDGILEAHVDVNRCRREAGEFDTN